MIGEIRAVDLPPPQLKSDSNQQVPEIPPETRSKRKIKAA